MYTIKELKRDRGEGNVEKEPEKPFISVDARGVKKVQLDTLFRALMQRAMGKALDLSRVSGMSDRSLQQFERTLKDDFYRIIEDHTQILKDFGYLPDNGKKS